MRGRIVLAAASALALACGGSGGTTAPTGLPDPGPPMATASVAATPSLAFTPAHVALVAGGTVTFTFGSVAHDVYFDDAPAGAPANVPGANRDTTVMRAFPNPGVYAFTCHIHPFMHGTVSVVPPMGP